MFFLKDSFAMLSAFYFASIIYYFVSYWCVRLKIKVKGLKKHFSMDPKYLVEPTTDGENSMPVPEITIPYAVRTMPETTIPYAVRTMPEPAILEPNIDCVPQKRNTMKRY